NSDGVWNDKGISLRVIVHPVFWDTLWFKILIGLLLIGVGFIVYNIRTNNIRRRNAQLREMNFALSKEIEERLRVEEALQVSEEKYRTITDNLHAGIYRNTAKSRGKFIEVNPTFVDMFGFNSKEEALDANATQLYTNVKDRNRFKRKIRKNGLVENEEFRLKRKDGSTFWASITAVAVYNDKGELRYYDGMIEDINERKRVEDALIESEEKYRILVERATDGILIIKKGKVAYANPRMSMISGYSGEELLGASLTSFLEDEEIEKLDEYDKNRKNKKEAASTYEIILHHKEGRKVVTEVNISPITYEGEPADLVFLRDISVRRHFEIQLRQTHKMEAIGHLAGGVAHDFNNILTVINGHAELAQLMMTKRHRAYKHIDDVIRSAEKASNLIRQLLAFSRQQIIEPKSVDVNNIITSLDKMLHRIIGEDLQIISNLAQDLPSIKADPGQIEQVLMNLIINARDAILENPNQKAEKLIVIETSEAHISESYAKENLDTKAGDYILISIKDNGKGMDQATIDRIFDPFFTTKEQGKGTGLGLATVFGIVKQNEGHILVDSKPGKGTIIKVYWPYAELEEMPDEDETLSELKIGGSETILLVEDEENVLEFTKEALESSGYQVLEASNGLEALNILKQNSRKIDLIISDVVMPKMTGQELAEKVKKNYPDLKVILMSGYTDSQIIRSGTERQSVNFIYKPFSIKTISKKVRDVLDR
ncbi:MAG: PAS domain S-box protein, partial [Calditrichaceae bacterium]